MSAKNFYAVARGVKTGIFTSWTEARPLVFGFSGSRYKGFISRSEAQSWLDQQQDQKTTFKPLQELVKAPVIDLKQPHHPPHLKLDLNQESSTTVDPKQSITIYCDGSCLGNGQSGARAGIGIYFGDQDPRNVSKRVDPTQYNQTNQVAELLAAITTLEILSSYRGTIHILTDSIYAVKSVNEWRHAWIKGNWTKKLVNLDLLKRLSKLVDARLPARTIFKHIDGHSGHEGNERADQLAKTGASSDTI